MSHRAAMSEADPAPLHRFPIQALASGGTFAQLSGGHFSTHPSETNCAIAVAKAGQTLRTLGVPIA
jgi:hypothetical protein